METWWAIGNKSLTVRPIEDVVRSTKHNIVRRPRGMKRELMEAKSSHYVCIFPTKLKAVKHLEGLLQKKLHNNKIRVQMIRHDSVAIAQQLESVSDEIATLQEEQDDSTGV